MFPTAILLFQLRSIRLLAHGVPLCRTLSVEGADSQPKVSHDVAGGEVPVAQSREEGTAEVSSEERFKQSICLPTVFVPRQLHSAIEVAIAGHSKKDCSEDGRELSEYLFKRVPPGCEWKKTASLNKSKDSLGDELENWVRSEETSPKVQVKSSVWAKKPRRTAESDDLRQEKSSKLGEGIRYGKRESLAFMAGRAQSSYGTALRVLSEVTQRDKTFVPQTLLDFGSGLGTVEWAAHQLWKDSIYEYQCVDISRDMLNLAQRLRLGGENVDSMLESEKEVTSEHIPGVYSRQYLPLSRKVTYDLVVSGHSLSDLPSAHLRSFTVAALWRKTKNYLVLIESGTWSGYKIIMEARNLILNSSEWTRFEGETEEDLQGHVFAPCLHDHQCPLLTQSDKLPKKPCHFAQRVQLSFSEKDTFLKRVGCRVENFSYIIFKKGLRDITTEDKQGRLIEPVKKRSRHILCQLCTSEGEVKRNIFTKKKHGKWYKEGRKSQWGDILNMAQDP